MQIYFSHSKQFDFKKDLYDPLENSALHKQHTLIFPHQYSLEAKDFISKNIIEESELLIAEVSYQGTGIGIELGRADAFGVPIWCIYQKGCKLSGSLSVVSQVFIEYESSNDLIDKLSKELTTFNL